MSPYRIQQDVLMIKDDIRNFKLFDAMEILDKLLKDAADEVK